MTNNLGEYFQISAEISGQRIADSTRKNYASKMKTWKKWLEEHRPQYVANSEVVLPLDEQTMLGFFGYISYKDVAKTKLRAASTIYSYYWSYLFIFIRKWNTPLSPTFITSLVAIFELNFCCEGNISKQFPPTH